MNYYKANRFQFFFFTTIAEERKARKAALDAALALPGSPQICVYNETALSFPFFVVGEYNGERYKLNTQREPIGRMPKIGTAFLEKLGRTA